MTPLSTLWWKCMRCVAFRPDSTDMNFIQKQHRKAFAEDTASGANNPTFIYNCNSPLTGVEMRFSSPQDLLRYQHFSTVHQVPLGRPTEITVPL